VIGNSPARYENELAAGCGLATNYRAITHPSLPNYLAATSGETWGVRDDGSPSAHPITARSVFEQAGSWREYVESAPGTCPTRSTPLYAQKHDPALYYTRLRGVCRQRVVSLGELGRDLAGGTLPRFASVVPDLCHDTHDCGVRAGDDWLRRWVPRIAGSAAYRSGRAAVFLVWDEGEGADQHVALIAIARSIRPGTKAARRFDHYSLLRTTEELLGLPYLGRARSALSMAGSLGLLASG